jgi:hypothetical protein
MKSPSTEIGAPEPSYRCVWLDGERCDCCGEEKEVCDEPCVVVVHLKDTL